MKLIASFSLFFNKIHNSLIFHKNKIVTIDNKKVKLQIWDTGNLEKNMKKKKLVFIIL